MVLPAKIFEIKEETDLELVFRRLKDFHEEESYQTDAKKTINLVTEVLDLKLKADSISGVFSRDFISSQFYKGEPVETPITEGAPFWIRLFKKKAFMIVMAPSGTSSGKKLLTSHVANQLSEVIFVRPWAIVEVRLSHKTMKDLHESNPQATKLIWFDDVDIPSIKKLCLAGDGLANTKLYNDYLKHGKIWYVVFKVQKRDIVVGITRNCVVTLFSKSTKEDFINYILEDLLKLIE